MHNLLVKGYVGPDSPTPLAPSASVLIGGVPVHPEQQINYMDKSTKEAFDRLEVNVKKALELLKNIEEEMVHQWGLLNEINQNYVRKE